MSATGTSTTPTAPRGRFADHAATVAAAWPPMTDEQLQRVAALLAPSTPAGGNHR